jgi:hypothetical protein
MKIHNFARILKMVLDKLQISDTAQRFSKGD